jgi:hypothetical protein
MSSTGAHGEIKKYSPDWRKTHDATMEAMWYEHASSNYTNCSYYCKQCGSYKYRLCACAKKRFIDGLYLGRVETYIKQQSDGTWRTKNAKILERWASDTLRDRVQRSRQREECKAADKEVCKCAVAKLVSQTSAEEFQQAQKSLVTSAFHLF